MNTFSMILITNKYYLLLPIYVKYAGDQRYGQCQKIIEVSQKYVSRESIHPVGYRRWKFYKEITTYITNIKIKLPLSTRIILIQHMNRIFKIYILTKITLKKITYMPLRMKISNKLIIWKTIIIL
jgi:hypothetical protein